MFLLKKQQIKKFIQTRSLYMHGVEKIVLLLDIVHGLLQIIRMLHGEEMLISGSRMQVPQVFLLGILQLLALLFSLGDMVIIELTDMLVS